MEAPGRWVMLPGTQRMLGIDADVGLVVEQFRLHLPHPPRIADPLSPGALTPGALTPPDTAPGIDLE